MKKFLNYFLNGLLITVPLVILLYVIVNLFFFLDDLLIPVLDFLGMEAIRFKGMGLIVLVVVIALLGYLGSTLIARPIKRWINRLLSKIPLIKTFYTAINDLLSAFVGKKKRFNQPVLVKMSKDSDLEKIGFITDSDLGQLGDFEGKVGVYFPHSYNFSGNLFIVSVKNIRPIHKNPSDVMKYIVSGGVSDFESDENE